MANIKKQVASSLKWKKNTTYCASKLGISESKYLEIKQEFGPQYKQVWETVYNEVETEIQLNEPIPKRRTYDPHEHIYTIDSIDTPSPKLNWLIADTDGRVSKQGTFSLSSLPSMMTKLKRTPPKI